jgi:Opioid growth factor receptor (OGFr) conserved region
MTSKTNSRGQLVGFYSGLGSDDRGRFLTEIQNWSDVQLERTHDYMQWLFPLVERSAFNSRAPILDAKTIDEFRRRPELRANFGISFMRMLSFYGFELVRDDVLRVLPSRSFAEQAENWLRPSNHNHVRITRILKSLRLLGLGDEAAAFLRCLTALYGKELTRAEPRISEQTFYHWQSAMGK